MISREKKALCALVDFKDASSEIDACFEAFSESMQCAIEDFNCSEEELRFLTFSKELVNWLSKGDWQTWKCRFIMNKAKNMKSWIRNLSVPERNILDFVWLNLWKEKCYQYGTRQVLSIWNKTSSSGANYLIRVCMYASEIKV